MGAWLLLLFSAVVAVGVANVVTLHGVRLLGPDPRHELPVPDAVHHARPGRPPPLRADPARPGGRRRGHRPRHPHRPGRCPSAAPCGPARARAMRGPIDDARRHAAVLRRGPASRSASSSTTTGRSRAWMSATSSWTGSSTTWPRSRRRTADYDAGRVGSRELMQWDMEVLPRDAAPACGRPLPRFRTTPSSRPSWPPSRRTVRRSRSSATGSASTSSRTSDGWRRRWPTCRSRPTRTASPARTA